MSIFRSFDYYVPDHCIVVPDGVPKGSLADLFVVAVHTGVFTVICNQWVKTITDYP
tara:strand:+ start:313 stop:480 length:168 start_codon:yes stop_codon:yes gene_type:complete